MAILMFALPLQAAVVTQSPTPEDDSAFASQITYDASAGAILTVPPFFKNKDAVDHTAQANAYVTNASAGSIDATPANATSSLAQGAVDHTAVANAYPTNASAGSIDGNPANASSALAQGAVDHTAVANAYPTNASAGSIDGNPANASAILAQGALDYTAEANMIQFDPVTGEITAPQPYSSYVEKVTPTLAFWGALVLALLLLFALIKRFRQRPPVRETC
jgi:hypothetical protein